MKQQTTMIHIIFNRAPLSECFIGTSPNSEKSQNDLMRINYDNNGAPLSECLNFQKGNDIIFVSVLEFGQG